MHDAPTPLLRDYPRQDPRLGRRLQLDARSLPFMIERTPAELRRPLRSIRWGRSIPILDQGDIGACVGFAATGLLGSGPWDLLDDILEGFLAPESEQIGKAQAFAYGLYTETTTVDPYEGVWPPTDTGTDGLSVCKVLKRRGIVGSYRHASTLDGLAQLLLDGPVLMGMPWRSAFFEPDQYGRIDVPGWERSPLAGGHEVVVNGIALDPARPSDLERATFISPNSWSASWGQAGYFLFSGATYQAMRDDVDLKQPLPRG